MREAVWRTARAMHREGLVRLSEGNVSARCGSGRVALTPTGLPYADMSVEDIVIVREDGTPVCGARRPTSELPMHLGLLAALPEIGAVVHTHSPYAVAFAACGRPIPAVIAGEAALVGGEVPVARLAAPGTPDMATAVLESVRAAPNRRAVLLQSHGLVAFGAGLDEALAVALYAEQMAQTTTLAGLLGTPWLLTDDFLVPPPPRG